MSTTQPPTLIRRLLHTSLLDLLRLRIHDGVTADSLLIGSGLDEPSVSMLRGMIRKTRLWRNEQRDVARELIAHFHDGIASGQTPESIRESFGDVGQSAKLIRRSKVRNRPALWHVQRFCRRAFLVLAAAWLLTGLWWLRSQPTVRVDYIAKINAPTLATPVSERAYTYYRPVMAELRDMAKQWTEHPDKRAELFYDGPETPGFETRRRWLVEHHGLLDQIESASKRETLGFLLGLDGDAREAGNPFGLSQTPPTLGSDDLDPEENRLFGEALRASLLPQLNYLQYMADMIAADAEVAAVDGQADRFTSRISTLHRLATHAGEDGTAISALVRMGIEARAIDQIDKAVRSSPALLSDDQIIRLSHELVPGRVPADLVRFDVERDEFRDWVQRSFTDDGSGNGHITPAGIAASRLFPLSPRTNWQPEPSKSKWKRLLAGPVLVFNGGSRKTLIVSHEAALRSLEDASRRTAFERDLPAAKFAADATGFTIGLDRALITADRLFARRDAVHVQLGVELYRRRFGKLPARLEDLHPTFLPAIPLDPIDGKPLRYKIVDGKPLVYSIGIDRDDDGGRMIRLSGGKARNSAAAVGFSQPAIPTDGDWILYPEPPDED